MKKVIITHANCSDGFTAAWIARKYYFEEQGLLEGDRLCFRELHYSKPENEDLDELIAGNSVEVFDFSFPRTTMIRYNSIARSFYVWDHHLTARDACEGLSCAHFNMEKSGAVLAWEYYYPGVPVPPFVQYVQDRDLWQWNLPQSREVNAYIGSWQRTFENWSIVAHTVNNKLSEATESGATLLRVQAGVIANSCKFAATVVLGGHKVPFLNLTSLISETLERLALTQPFAASYFMDKQGQFVFSLRSEKHGLNVGEIAKRYGGGGHEHAAGFTCNYTQFGVILGSLTQWLNTT